MRPKLFLRIAAGIMLFHAVAHTFGHSGWKHTADPTLQKVIDQMTGPQFPFMGVMRSMGQYFDGYGYGVTIAMLVFVSVLWVLGGAVHPGASPVNRPVDHLIIILGLGLLIFSVDEFIFFFPLAAGTSLLAALFTFLSLYKRSAQTRYP